MSEEEKRIAHAQYQQHYGTFQPNQAAAYSQPSAPPAPPAIGFPQPVPPPLVPPQPPYQQPPAYPAPVYYAHGYQAIPVYHEVAEGRPILLRMRRLPFCGMGTGWFLFIIGFFLAAIPWYVGAFILLFVRVDYREKPGLVACTIAAVLAAIAVFVGATKEADSW